MTEAISRTPIDIETDGLLQEMGIQKLRVAIERAAANTGVEMDQFVRMVKSLADRNLILDDDDE